ncbi:MAG TPA: ATP-grasp domain-containing protein [Xanthobacteraceae bacterium]
MSLSTTSLPAADRRPDEARPIGALVVGGSHRSLALIRSLGRRGIPVAYLNDDHPIASYSRYAGRSFAWDGPGSDGAIEFLKTLARTHRLEGWVLIAAGDAELRLLSQHHAELAAIFRMAVPPWETVRWTHDKRLTYERAAALGIDYPRCYNPRDLAEVEALDCRFPVVLKPTVREQKNAFTRAKAWQVDGRAALLARYRQAAALVDERAIVLQELIPGGGMAQFSCAAVWHRGAPVASLMARRTRQYPIDFGFTSTFVETIAQKEVEAAACRFLQSISYSGLVEVEFKHDHRDGRYKILDVNARAWTWNALGSIAGVDFAHLLCRLAMGETLEPLRGHADVAWMHGSRDILAAALEIMAGKLSPADYLRSWRKPLVFAAFAKDNLMPGLIDLPLGVARVLGRYLSRPARPARSADGSRLRPSH